MLEGDSYAFANCLEFSSMMRYDMQRVKHLKILLRILTGSENLLKDIVKSSTTTDKGLKVDI